MCAKPNRRFNIFLDPAEIQSLDSMEGVPYYDPVTADSIPGEPLLTADWQKRLHRGFDWVGTMAPGVFLAMFMAIAGSYIATWIGQSLLGFERSPLSPILVAVVLGLMVRKIAGLPKAYEQGLRLCLRLILRVGVALLGLKLSISAIGKIGLSALPVVIGCVAAAIFVVSWLARLVKVPSRLSGLISVGTSICGVSAVIAAGTATKADEDEISYSVAVITLFGIIALFTYPFLAHWLFSGNPEQVGLFLGTAIHDTSQVVGAGLMYQLYYDAPITMETAVTTKLVRNIFMGLVIPIMAVSYHRKQAAARPIRVSVPWLKWSQWIPPFLIGFVVLAAIRSIGDLGEKPFGYLSSESWDSLIGFSSSVSVFLLSTAIAAVGLGTNISKIITLGWRPLFIGFSAALIVGVISYVLVTLLY